MSPSLDPATLRALAEKYAALVRLSTEPPAREAGPYAARRRADKRALAARFPGALRELDAVSANGLRERAATVEALLLAHADEALTLPGWLPWIAQYHTLLRDALTRRVASANANPGNPGEVRRALERIAADAGVSVDSVRRALFPTEF